MPIPIAKNSLAPAGARNLESAITLKVTRISRDSTLSKIIQLITEASSAKPKIERWIDRFDKKYATTIISLTFLFALGMPVLFSIPFLGGEGSIYRSLAFLIAASPCALIIATPTAYLSAISSCARQGILLKGGVVLDSLANCRTVAFDKTGTLTTGDLQCVEIDPLGEVDKNTSLAIAAALEKHVTHPIGAAICNLAQNLPLPTLTDVQVIPGFGIRGRLPDTAPVAIGRPSQIAPNLALLQKEGQALALLDVGGSYTLFRFSDEIRPVAKTAIDELQTKCNLNSIMLTGDHAASAAKVASALGIKTYFSDIKPEEKLQKVAEYSDAGGLAMVGDGINDAPALTRATVGISMGKIGSATAVDASDVVLLNDDLTLLPNLFLKAKKTQNIVRQNLTLALGVIFCATLPALFGLIPLWIAVLLHEGGTVLVGLNSLRLLRKR
jgi:Cd2+/Zn2+-exporting ATPase